MLAVQLHVNGWCMGGYIGRYIGGLYVGRVGYFFVGSPFVCG